jgi:hypothetical protein
MSSMLVPLRKVVDHRSMTVMLCERLFYKSQQEKERKTLRKLATAIRVSHTTLAQTKDDPGDCIIHPHLYVIKLALDDHHKFA